MPKIEVTQTAKAPHEFICRFSKLADREVRNSSFKDYAELR